ncbi:MAG: ferredoxin [Actinomycetes bacterium]
MKVHVDMEKCQHYGQCVFEAPDIFKLNAEDRLEYLATAEDSESAKVKAAADVCPMQAITITE